MKQIEIFKSVTGLLDEFRLQTIHCKLGVYLLGRPLCDVRITECCAIRQSVFHRELKYNDHQVQYWTGFYMFML